MKIKRDVEVPSTVIAKSVEGERMYWTGSDWTDNLLHARRYPRQEAMKKAVKKKKAFHITLGFRI